MNSQNKNQIENQLTIQSDVQSEVSQNLTALTWVGMEKIQASLAFSNQFIPCFVNLYVNLESGHRGIHMSRLYNNFIEMLNQKQISLELLEGFLKECINSQDLLSHQSKIMINLDLPMTSYSLKSEKKGFRNYPIEIISTFNKVNNKFETQLQFEITYSSTCPQSASLALEVLKQRENDNNKSLTIKSNTDLNINSNQYLNLERLPATPHAQRSKMICKVSLNNLFFQQNASLSKALIIPNTSKEELKPQTIKSIEEIFYFLIKIVENSLGTPVQTSVKKADEMQFAILNAENLMFCEDAVRKVESLFNQLKENQIINSFIIRTQHEESLHPHNAVAIIE